MFESLPREDTLVIYHCSVGPELGSFTPIPLVCFAYFGDRSDGHLRGKLELASGFEIHKFLEPHLVGCAVPMCDLSDEVAGFIETMHGLFQCFKPFFRCIQLDQERLLHSSDNTVQYSKKKISPIPPTAEAMGFLGDVYVRCVRYDS